MMRTITPTFLALAFTLFAASASADVCDVAALKGPALQAMRNLKLIRPGEESTVGGTRFEWRLKAAIPGPNGACFLAMNVAMITGHLEEFEYTSFELLVLKGGKITSFETAMGLDPKTDHIRVAFLPSSSESIGWTAKKFLAEVPQEGGGIGIEAVGAPAPSLPQRHVYFVELAGQAAIDARKMIAAGNYFIGQGLGGIVVPGQKPSFDPTPGRNWHVEEAYVNLRTAIAGEAYNISAIFFDQNLMGTLAGNPRVTQKTKRMGCGFAYSFFPVEVDSAGRPTNPIP